MKIKLGLRFKVVSLFIALEVLLALAIGYLYASKGIQIMRDEFYHRGKVLASYLAHAAQVGVLGNNIAALDELCDKGLRNHDIVGIRILDDEGEQLVSCSIDTDAPSSVISAPIMLEHGSFTDPEGVYTISGSGQSEMIGVVEVKLSKEDLLRRIRELQIFVVGVCLAALTVSVVVGVFLVDVMIVRPILRLRDATEKFAQGDLEVRLSETGDDEIAELARSFNIMARSLKGYISQQISSATDKLQLKNLAMLGELSAMLMHEVGNALNRIGVIKYQLSQEKLSPMGQRAIESLESEMGSLKRFTSDVRLFSQRPEVRKSKVDLRSLIQGLCSSLSLMDTKDVSIGMELPGRQIQVEADKELLNQALLNLLTNAYDAVAPGGKIVVKVEDGPSTVCIMVMDDGPGIPEPMAEEVFKPFFSTKGPKGTGLGLSIAKSFIEAQGGMLRLESRLGMTCFSVCLPRRGKEPGTRIAAGHRESGHV